MRSASPDPGEAQPGIASHAGTVTLPSRQLLVFGFDADAAFEGQLVGALERLESGGALRIIDVLFVATDEATGEFVSIALRGDTAGLTAKLLDFRLDSAARRRAGERALGDDAGEGTAELVRDLGGSLKPGTAMAAVLVEHIWSQALEDAVSRVSGRSLASEFVEASTLSELADNLVRAAR
jgi:hypothetical protein